MSLLRRLILNNDLFFACLLVLYLVDEFWKKKIALLITNEVVRIHSQQHRRESLHLWMDRMKCEDYRSMMVVIACSDSPYRLQQGINIDKATLFGQVPESEHYSAEPERLRLSLEKDRFVVRTFVSVFQTTLRYAFLNTGSSKNRRVSTRQQHDYAATRPPPRGYRTASASGAAPKCRKDARDRSAKACAAADCFALFR